MVWSNTCFSTNVQYLKFMLYIHMHRFMCYINITVPQKKFSTN